MPLPLPLPLLQLLLLLPAATAAGRLDLNFNYGWKFLYQGPEAGGPQGGCSNDPSGLGLSCAWTALPPNTTCSGMERNPNRCARG